jgi:ribosomal protein S18 acetylase RimI-like enzyme
LTPHLISLSKADWSGPEALLSAELGGRWQARRGHLVDGLEGEGRLAIDDAGMPIGLVTWLVGGADSAPGEAEIRVLVVAQRFRRRGVGGALLAAAETALAADGVRRAWLVTTNDNVGALAFYQQRRWRLAELRVGAVDSARATLKPAISPLAENGIPIRDELVLRKDLP